MVTNNFKVDLDIGTLSDFSSAQTSDLVKKLLISAIIRLHSLEFLCLFVVWKNRDWENLIIYV